MGGSRSIYCARKSSCGSSWYREWFPRRRIYSRLSFCSRHQTILASKSTSWVESVVLDASGIPAFAAAVGAVLPESVIFLRAKEAERANGTDITYKTKVSSTRPRPCWSSTSYFTSTLYRLWQVCILLVPHSFCVKLFWLTFYPAFNSWHTYLFNKNFGSRITLLFFFPGSYLRD